MRANVRPSRNNGGRVPTGDVSRLGPPPEWEMTGMGGKPSKGTSADGRLKGNSGKGTGQGKGTGKGTGKNGMGMGQGKGMMQGKAPNC